MRWVYGVLRIQARFKGVQILGHDGDVQWVQDNASLCVKIPANISSDAGFTLKVDMG